VSVSVVVLALTALWHLGAVWHFAVTPARTIARSTSERPVNLIATELFRFLGAMNAAFVVLAVAAIWLDGRALAHLTLAAANLSQLVIDVRVHRKRLAHGPMFMQIYVGDALFTALNAAALGVALRT
jgi:hypothetical protein